MRRNLFKIGILLILCGLFLSSSLAEGYSFVVAEDDQLLYSEPGVTSGRVYYANAGDVLYYLDEDIYRYGHYWYSVLYNEEAVWICDRCASVCRNISQAQTYRRTFLRKWAGEDWAAVCSVPASQTVTFSGFNWDDNSELWLRVSWNENVGYIPAKDLVLSDALSGPSGNSIRAILTEDHMATRSGPSTKYLGTGNYYTCGTPVKIFSRVYDSVNEIWWVQAEAESGGYRRRVYTGSWRFADINLYDLPLESYISSRKLNSSQELMYGPGYEYDSYGVSINGGTAVDIYAYEVDWAQIDCWVNGTHYRAWIPGYSLN